MVISLPYITLHIRGKPVRFLCDTGSMLNLMSPSVRERLELNMRLAPGTVMGVTGASLCEGVCEGDDGRGVVMESIHHKAICRARFVVGPTGQSDCILGMPFFVDNRADIRYVLGKGTLITFDAGPLDTKPTSSRKKATNGHRVTLVATDELQIRRGYEWPAQASQAHLSASAIVPCHVVRPLTQAGLPLSPRSTGPFLADGAAGSPVKNYLSHSTNPQAQTTLAPNLRTLCPSTTPKHALSLPPDYIPLRRRASSGSASISWKSFTHFGARTFVPNR